MKKLLITAIMLLSGLFMMSATMPAQAHENMFQKAGKAVQYTTRKDTENLSIDTHRTLHEKSVWHNRHTGWKYVVTPNGHKYPIYHHHHKHHTM